MRWPRRLQMERTRFRESPRMVTIDEHPYSTAADVARLTRYAMNNAGFRFYVSQKNAANLVQPRRSET